MEILNYNPEIHVLQGGKMLSTNIVLGESDSLEGSWVVLDNGSKICLTPFKEVGSIISDYNILIFNKEKIMFESKTQIKNRGLLLIDKFTYMVTEKINYKEKGVFQYEAIPFYANQHPQETPTQIIYFYK